MTAMSTTHNPYVSLTSLSDLEARLFSAPICESANSAAFVQRAVTVPRTPAANQRSFLPDPPTSRHREGIVESFLLRAA